MIPDDDLDSLFWEERAVVQFEIAKARIGYDLFQTMILEITPTWFGLQTWCALYHAYLRLNTLFLTNPDLGIDTLRAAFMGNTPRVVRDETLPDWIKVR